jgi:hypothetical protein
MCQYFVGARVNLLSMQNAVKVSGQAFKARYNNEPMIC